MSPTHIGFIGVKKMGQKSHTWAPLRTVMIFHQIGKKLATPMYKINSLMA